MRFAFLLPFFCLAACNGRGGEENGNSPDLDAAANRAQWDIANYAAATPARPGPKRVRPVPQPSPLPLPSPTSTSTSTSSVGAPRDVSSPTRGDEDDIRSARDTVLAYGKALSAGRYRDAWAMWRGGGAASGMSAAAFAASFARYRMIRSSVGAPYGQDAGAGQRYVTVPLTLSGDLKSGAPFAITGPVVLHRVADGIDSSDPGAHDWQIESTGLKMQAGPQNAAPR